MMRGPLIVRPSQGRAQLSGSIMRDASEATIRSAAYQDLSITLVGDEWAPQVGRQASDIDLAVSRELLNGIVPSLNDAGSWSAVVQPALSPMHVLRTSPHTVRIELPQLLQYDINEPETLTVTIPASAVRSGRPIVATPTLRILALNGTLQLRGSLLASPTEIAIQSAPVPPTIRLDLLGDSWSAGIGLTQSLNGTLVSENEAASYALLNSLVSLQKEAKGFEAIVRSALRATDITRLTNSSIEISLPDARLDYDITEPETITVTAPETALLSGRQVVALPHFIILPTKGFGVLSNSLVSNNSETDVQGGGMQLTVTLQGDSWAPSIGQRGSGTRESLTQQVLRAFISAQDEDGGWNAVVQKALTFTELSYVDDEKSSITLTLPSFPAYDLLKAETVSCNLPPAAVASGQELFAGIGTTRDALQISANTGTIRLSGSLFEAANETTLRSVATVKIVITLTGDTWTQGVGQQDETGEGASAQLLRGFTSLQNEPYGWNSIVRPGIPQANVERTNDFRVEISVPQFAAYEVTEPETIEVVVPPIAVSSAQVVQAPSFVIIPMKGQATLSGRMVEDATETLLCCTEGLQLIITLIDDSFAPGVGVDAAASMALERGLTSLQDEPDGWNNQVMPALVARNSTAIRRLSDHQIELTLPPIRQYQLRNPETLVVSIPASAVSSQQRLVAAPSQGLVIAAAPSTCILGGDVYPTVSAHSLRKVEGNTLFITLVGDSFVSQVALPGPISDALLAGIASAQATEEPFGWSSIVSPALHAHHVEWNAANASEIAITIPQSYLYAISSPETIMVTIPSSAVESSRRASHPAAFVVRAKKPVIRLSGSLLDRATDEGVRSDENLDLNLLLDDGDEFMPHVGMHTGITRELLDGIALDRGLDAASASGPLLPVGASSANTTTGFEGVHPALQRYGWELATASLTEDDVELVSASMVRIRFPPIPFYRPQTPETLSITVPAGALRSGRTTAAESMLVLASGSTSARLTGPLIDTPFEGLVQSHAMNVTITLHGDIFKQPLQTALILSGLNSSNTEATGFLAHFSAAMVAGNVNVTAHSTQEVIIRMPPLPGLRLSASETVTVTVPALATVHGGRDIVCNPQFVLRPRQALLSGSLVGSNVDEARLRSIDHELIITLKSDTFVSSIGEDSVASAALIQGLSSGIREALRFDHLVRVDDTVVRIVIYASLQVAYSIHEPETVTITLPAEALVSNVTMAIPAFVISAVPGTATFYSTFEGTFSPRTLISEQTIAQSAFVYKTHVDLAVGSDTWAPAVGEDNQLTHALLQGFIASGEELHGWNRIVRQQLTSASCNASMTTV